ncbi:CaiB/BaiF CoA transferase family protein [Limobrevibacterium gyesilva]|uniref:CoA transferase n=1 Tax=Limobrevibacterium gyesilva TaxID=2991712 RepID=A0AA41YNI9_9PROT|nr:CoA transferase [Limobrevibacterium gyesilva]MCW3475642.1 CoA transferase [Limobrevibacterium gyesilva]
MPDASQATKRPPPLAGVRVIDLTQVYNGPYATFMMARNGAEVIKIEPPGGEHLRRRASGSDLPFAMLNGNKRSVVLDLKTPEGVATVLKLADSADVLVENFTPGVMARLGLGWDVLRERNPRLIYACSSGYGIDGPYRDYPAMDLSVQAMSGILGITGFADQPPVKTGATLCDFLAGTHVYAAVVTALFERTRSGLGQMVEIAMLEAAYFSLTSNLGTLFRAGGGEVGRTGNRHGGLSICPYNVYPAKDGFVAILCSNDKHFASLTKALDMPELGNDPRYGTNKGRVAAMEAIDACIGARMSTLTKAEAFARLMRHHVPSAPVRTLREVVDDPHLHARGALRWIDHPQHGRLVIAESPLRLHGCERADDAPSVPLGQDTEAVLRSIA